MKIKAEINEMENKISREKINKTKSESLKISIQLISLYIG